MTRQEGSEQISEYLLHPDYWDGHSLDDDCDWEESQIRDYNELSQIFRLVNNDQKPIIKASAKYMKEFFDMAQGDFVVLTRFSPGQVFDASRQNVGTIIRERFEIIWARSNGNLGGYGEDQVFGVVCEVKTSGDLQKGIAFYGMGKAGNLGLFMRFEKEPIMVGEVGEVKHNRIKSAIPLLYTHSIRRTLGIETVLPGEGSRTFNPERGIGFSPRLSPQSA